MQSGPRQHTLPAAYLAGFADVRRSRARESLLSVGRRGVPHVFTKKSEGIGVVRDIYTLTSQTWAAKDWTPQWLDNSWAPVERGISSAIESIVTNTDKDFDARTWLLVLVEFASQIFVRGNDFAARFVARFPEELAVLFKVGSPDHVNAARLLELHRLRGAIRQANWTILHASGGRFVTSDTARTPIFFGERRNGYIIPLRFDAALALTFTPKHEPMRLRRGAMDNWVIGPVNHETVSEARVGQLNQMLTSSAVKEIYGAPSVVSDLHATMTLNSPPNEIVEPTLLAPYRDLGDTHSYEQLVVQVITPQSQSAQQDFVSPSLI